LIIVYILMGLSILHNLRQGGDPSANS